jgi:hypothetical protein
MEGRRDAVMPMKAGGTGTVANPPGGVTVALKLGPLMLAGVREAAAADGKSPEEWMVRAIGSEVTRRRFAMVDGKDGTS